MPDLDVWARGSFWVVLGLNSEVVSIFFTVRLQNLEDWALGFIDHAAMLATV